MKYGFYSKKADEFYGHTVYLNENKQEIKVTYVTDDPLIGYFQYLWKDKEFVGTIVKYVRKESGIRNWRPPWLACKGPKWIAQIFDDLE